jgi:hypothetical protein
MTPPAAPSPVRTGSGLDCCLHPTE